MRQTHTKQLQLGQTLVEEVKFDLQSRDDIPQILRGLQHIYETVELRDIVFSELEKLIPAEVDKDNGRPGMDLWKIFVLGTLRLNLNIDYDRLMELANEHRSLRLILGHDATFDIQYRYRLQTLKDNLRLFTPEILYSVNQAIVNAGHRLLGQEEARLIGRCDSFVVETDVEYPTDIKLLQQAIHKVIYACGEAGVKFGVPGWRQFEYNDNGFRRLYLQAQGIKHSTSKDEEKKAAQQKNIVQKHENLIERAEFFLERAQETLDALGEIEGSEALRAEIDYFGFHAWRQIDQIRRRVIEGEKIPHREKVFSLYEPHTEWISKGKAGVPVELGLRVCVVEDKMGFILHHKVMQQETDEKVAIEMVTETCRRFPNFRVCSFDKGFQCAENREELAKHLDRVVMPKKGRLSESDKEKESAPEFVALRRQHSAVESAINALEVHGLDVCPDHGLDGFKRYVALAIVGRNIQKLGVILLEREREAERRRLQKEKRAA